MNCLLRRAQFFVGGAVNKQNVRVWGTQRPDVVYESPQSTESPIVWCALSKTEIFGTYFFQDGTVTRERYKRMLRYYLFPKLNDYPHDMLFQQDGAPSHYAVVIRDYFGHETPKPMDWEGWTHSMACTVSRFDPL